MANATGLLALLPLLLAASPAFAETGFTLGLNLAGDGERKTIQYDCAGRDPLTVDYLNAAPNFLAIVPVDGAALVFASVLSASGAKYAAGQYLWWTKGPDANFYDLTQGEAAAPLFSCTEHIQTP